MVGVIKTYVSVSHSHVVYLTLILRVCVCVRACEGGAADPDAVACLCATSTHGDGGSRLHTLPGMSGNLLQEAHTGVSVRPPVHV